MTDIRGMPGYRADLYKHCKDKGEKIHLIEKESRVCITVGGDRNLRALYGVVDDSNRSPDEPELPAPKWEDHIEAAGSELSVAKALDLYWVVGESKFDVAGIEVRCSRMLEYGLRILPKDIKVDLPGGGLICVLVIGQIPDFQVVGWYGAKEAAAHDNTVDNWKFNPQNRNDGLEEKKIISVPQFELHSLEPLREYMHEWLKTHRSV